MAGADLSKRDNRYRHRERGVSIAAVEALGSLLEPAVRGWPGEATLCSSLLFASLTVELRNQSLACGSGLHTRPRDDFLGTGRFAIKPLVGTGVRIQ